MAEENLNQELEGQGGSENAGQQSEGTASEQGWAGPSQDEWLALQKQNEQLAAQLGQITQAFNEPEEYDYSGIDLSDPRVFQMAVNTLVDERMKGISPYVKTAAQDQGQREMHKMFDGFEKQLSTNYPDGFDRDLAERTAFYFFDQHGDAEKAVKDAAEYAAQVRKSDRDAAVESLRSKATKSGRGASDEPRAAGSAVPGREPFKSYDEVVDYYAHQTEV